jgi:preprotein translocase subunit SecA
MSVLEKIFGSQNIRFLKKIEPIIDQINKFEPVIKALTDNDLSKKTIEFKERLKKGDTLDDILPEAFAVVRESSWRVLGQRHYDVQLIGAMTLHKGMIAEMKTGEGKTLAATPAVYLNALTEKGVHVVTVNDYLAKRDAEWMSPIYNMLGLTVGTVLTSMDNEEKRENYNKDITYGTNNEFGFDYLRDNMVFDLSQKVQRGFNYCIVDEVDSVLIDEARTPLIISGAAENDTKHILNARKFVTYFKECDKNPDGRYPDEADPFNPQKPVGDFKIDEKSKNINFTDDGLTKAEKLLQERHIIQGSLFIQENFEYVHYLTQAMKAHYLFHNDVDYLVKDGEVQIIDEHTGRVLPGRRYSDGLHQAIEAKENIQVQRRSKTFASITFQNFFRMYKKLAGMTGTADTEAAEFKNIYNLDVVVIPTNVPMARIDNADRVYLNFKDKSKAIIDEIKEIHKKGQPILIGTISVEKSEVFSALLKKANIRHNVLNAKNHAREAEIISEAGRIGSVTIATNMAGRGTDIKLGGERKYDEAIEEMLLAEDITDNDRHILPDFKELLDRMKLKEAESMLDKFNSSVKKRAIELIDEAYEWIEENKRVKEAGGLFILGTERHESRRIDNQLRGRSGRQGDNGMSRFYISMDDDLMRLFGGERIQKMLSGFGMNNGELIEHPWISSSIEKAQKKVESRNFEIRKHLLEYDDVLNKQRFFIYEKRDEILFDKNIIDRVFQTTQEMLEELIEDFMENLKKSNEYAFSELSKLIKGIFFIEPVEVMRRYQNDPKSLYENLEKILKDELYEKDSILGHEYLNLKLRELYLYLIDRSWQDHLENMEQLRESVMLRSYSQKNPLIEYKIEGSTMFEQVIQKIRESVVNQIFKIKIESVSVSPSSSAYSTNKADYTSFSGTERNSSGNREKKQQNEINTTTVVNAAKVGRNELCPCGSGKKYKHCCGRNQ